MTGQLYLTLTCCKTLCHKESAKKDFAVGVPGTVHNHNNNVSIYSSYFSIGKTWICNWYCVLSKNQEILPRIRGKWTSTKCSWHWTWLEMLNCSWKPVDGSRAFWLYVNHSHGRKARNAWEKTVYIYVVLYTTPQQSIWKHSVRQLYRISGVDLDHWREEQDNCTDTVDEKLKKKSIRENDREINKSRESLNVRREKINTKVLFSIDHVIKHREDVKKITCQREWVVNMGEEYLTLTCCRM